MSSPLGRYREKRDFSRTSEPPPGESASADGLRAFTIQLHDASRLHFDLRLEAGGVLKSWAVPKGPSLDPSDRRLAIETEDHPLAYGEFEGTIPEGEYGGGTVLLWDRGRYRLESDEDDPDAAFDEAYRSGKIDFELDGKRLGGRWMLRRTDDESGERSKWLLFRRGEKSGTTRLPAPTRARSVKSGRTLRGIAADAAETERPAARAPNPTDTLSPMLAVAAADLPTGPEWTFEPKYDGVRILAFATPGGARLITRNGNDRSREYGLAADAARSLSAEVDEPVVLDGEVVAWGPDGPRRFGDLQRGDEEVAPTLVAFDILLRGETLLAGEPDRERRGALEGLLGDRERDGLRLAERTDDGAALAKRAREAAWEGVMAKRLEAPYRPGRRSVDWLKVKLENRQELVVGGYTAPTGSRGHFGSLLVGYYAGESLHYAGKVGSGYSGDQLEEIHRKLRRIERKTSPFKDPPAGPDITWVSPKLVVEVRFNEWTRAGRLRQPVFLGLRTDRDPTSIGKEAAVPVRSARIQSVEGEISSSSGAPRPARWKASVPADSERERICGLLTDLEEAGENGEIGFRGRGRIRVTSLDKPLFPEDGITKGDVMRYYVRMARYVLPVIGDRPLVLKRYPGGLGTEPFYQQKPAEHFSDLVRVETIATGDGDTVERVVGGDLPTLLSLVQIGAVSLNPWHARVQSIDTPDYTIIDLDPGPSCPFERVVEVALRTREAMDALGLRGAVKTSGSSGAHIYLPLPPGTPDEAARLLAQIVATTVASQYPRIATVERTVNARSPEAVYVDYLQNVQGKSVATAYSVRMRPGAPVSTPVTWKELDSGIRISDFTVENVPERLASGGTGWIEMMGAPNDLDAFQGTG